MMPVSQLRLWKPAMDKFLALRWFVETVDTKGFSAAARSLNVATSSVTRLMDALEQELGTTLLNRSTRQVTVTEAGSLYYIKARQLLEDLELADAQVHDQGVAIRLGSPGAHDELICRSLGYFQRYVVASPVYLSRRGCPDQPEDLTRHDCLRFSFSKTPQTWTFVKQGETRRVAIKGRLRSNNAEVLHKVALADGGITLLADWLVQADIESGRLTRLFPDHDVNPNQASTAISALYLPNRRGSRRVSAFIEFCEERLSSLRIS